MALGLFYGIICGMFIGALGGFLGGVLAMWLCYKRVPIQRHYRRVPRLQRGVENPPMLRRIRRGGPTVLRAGPRRCS